MSMSLYLDSDQETSKRFTQNSIQTKMSHLRTPLRLGLLAVLIGISVSAESSAQVPAVAIRSRLTISNINVSEPANGQVAQATLTVTLRRRIFGQPQTQPVNVNYQTVDGTATAGEDYEPTSGTLTFSGQEKTKTITVMIKGDALQEDSEDLIVQLSNPQGAVLSDGQGQIIIKPPTPPGGGGLGGDECPTSLLPQDSRQCPDL